MPTNAIQQLTPHKTHFKENLHTKVALERRRLDMFCMIMIEFSPLGLKIAAASKLSANLCCTSEYMVVLATISLKISNESLPEKTFPQAT